MNSLTLPPSPNWYEDKILACAPDNTLIYGARTDIVIIENSDENVPLNIRIISRAHAQKIISVCINKKWGISQKLIVSVSEDKTVKVWDAESSKVLYSHNKHLLDSRIIGATFASDEKVISVSQEGTIIVWNLPLNETNIIRDLLGLKVTVTCISTCPHANWLTAFGLKNGLIIAADLRKNGKVLFKMRGHDKSITSLSWCPVPINIFPKNPSNTVMQKNEDDQFKEIPQDVIKSDINLPLLKAYGYNEDDGKYLQKYLLKNYDFVDVLKIDSTIKTQETDTESKNNQHKQNGKDEQNLETVLQETPQDDDNNDNIDTDSVKEAITPVLIEEEPRKDFLLASSAKEGNIYIWRAGTDGRMQTFLTLPNKTKNKYKSVPDKIWITLCWITPTILLSSSKSSELIAWTLPKPHDHHQKNYSIIHKDHTSLLFSIAAPIQLLNEYNWKESVASNAWTISQDRLLLNTKINAERTNLVSYPTFGGSIQKIQTSQLDPNRLAIGTSDGFIKLWDLSRPHTKHIFMTNFYQKIQSKVSALAWHPSNELILAFGTSEGRVGYIDPNNKSKMPILFPQYFKSEVYKLEWGPMPGNKSNFGLYAVGEGQLILFDINKSRDPIEIDKPHNTFIYSMAWKPDYSLLLLATKSGSVLAYSPEAKLLCKHYFQQRINDIIWHPNTIDSNTKESNWFASISNGKSVIVYDFNIECGDNDKNIISTFDSKGDQINAVSWSPHNTADMVIGCDSGVIQIWDAVNNTVKSTFINPSFVSVLSVVWSPLDPNFILSAGKDNTLRVWNITEYPPISYDEILKQKKTDQKTISSDSLNVQEKPDSTIEEKTKVKKSSKNVLLPKFYTPQNLSTYVSDLKKLLLWKEVECFERNMEENDILNIFVSDEAMMNLVTLNESIHMQKGKYNLNMILSLFRGDISTSIKKAIEEKRVTPEIISLSPMVSPKLWQTACETYAEQLSEDSDSNPLEIATYYLACHQVEKAVKSLCDNSLFREALALAKCRMMGDSAIKDIVEKWATYSMYTGNFEIAAQCNIYLGKYDEAAMVLFRRSDLELLEFALQLVSKSGNIDLQKAILFRHETIKSGIDVNEVELPTKKDAFLKCNEGLLSVDCNVINKENDKEINITENLSSEDYPDENIDILVDLTNGNENLEKLENQFNKNVDGHDSGIIVSNEIE